MTDAEKQKLIEDLHSRKSRLIEQLKGVATENPAVKGDFEPMVGGGEEEDDDDGINASTRMDTDFAMEQELEKELEGVKLALERLEKGTYGTCAHCLTKIPAGRLKAMPVAALCINCAQAQLS